jgi:hypothetical protein
MANTFSKLNDGNWGIRGQGLVEGETVKVEKRDAAPVWLKVGTILTDRNGYQTATIDRSKGPRKTRTCSAPVVVETVVAPEPPPLVLDWSQAEAEDDADLNWEM